MITPRLVAENIMAAVDDMHIENSLPLYADQGNVRTDTAVMELRPLNVEAGFSVVLSNGEAYRVLVAKV